MERDKESQNLVFMGTLCNERIKCGNIATMIIHENARKWIKTWKFTKFGILEDFERFLGYRTWYENRFFLKFYIISISSIYIIVFTIKITIFAAKFSAKTGIKLYETIKMCVFDKNSHDIMRCSSALLLRNQNTYFLSPLYINTL